jgi:hypothetical protein
MSDAANEGRTGEVPEWQRRYLATSITMPAWSPDAPERVVYTSDESGSNQVWALDLSTGQRRRVTNSAVGIITEEMTDPTPSADGLSVLWFEDVTGDESGRWLTEPFGGGETTPLFPETEVAVGWPSGLAVGRRTMVFAMGFDEGFVAYVTRDGEPVRELLRSVDDIQVPVPEWGGFNTSGLSRDESLVAVRYTPRGNNLHMAIRVFDTATGDVAGELDDGEGMDLWASGWSPVAGDQRLVIRHELAGCSRPALWDVETGERTDLEVGDLPGEIEALGWWPDASAVLVVQFHDATNRLHRYDISTGAHTPIDHPDGCIWGAGVRPNGDVNHGFIDLRDRPELVHLIPEANASPGLQKILVALNRKGSRFMSLGANVAFSSKTTQQIGQWRSDLIRPVVFRDFEANRSNER